MKICVGEPFLWKARVNRKGLKRVPGPDLPKTGRYKTKLALREAFLVRRLGLETAGAQGWSFWWKARDARKALKRAPGPDLAKTGRYKTKLALREAFLVRRLGLETAGAQG